MNVKRILWYAARFLSAVLAGFYLFIMIGGLVEGEGIGTDWESIGMTILSLSGIAAVIYAWVDARRGGWAILAIGVAFTIFALVTAGQRHWMAVLGGGVPFLLIGLLFLMGERGN